MSHRNQNNTNRMTRSSLLSVCAALLIVGGCSTTDTTTTTPPPKHIVKTPPRSPVAPPVPKPVSEVRGVWVSDTTRLDWNQATADLQRAGYNAMYVNLASGGSAFYPSSILPRVGNSDIARGIALAHQRGIAVHGKFIVTFMFKTPPSFQNKLRTQGRIMRGADGKPIEQSGFFWLCPSQPENLGLAKATVTEMCRYPVDGVQFDYIRFNENPSCFCPHCRQEFERSVGAKMKRWPADALTGTYASRFEQWRIGIINSWMQELSRTARETRPGVVVSAATFPDLARAREEKGQDWKTWVDRGWVDYICPMNYTTDPASFEKRLRETQTAAARPGKVVCGIGSWKFKDMAPLTGQINATRRLGSTGFILFSWDDCEARNFLPKLK